eukprot:tig00021281_g19905.t1
MTKHKHGLAHSAAVHRAAHPKERKCPGAAPSDNSSIPHLLLPARESPGELFISRLGAGVAGFALGGPVGAAAGVLGVHTIDAAISAERGHGGIVHNKSLDDVRAHEPIRRVALWSAPLMVSSSRALNPLIDAVNGVLGVSHLVGGDIVVPKPEHQFITVETHDHTFYVLQKCHTGDIRFVRKPTLAAAISEGVAWGGSRAQAESAVLEEELSVPPQNQVPLAEVSDWVHTQEPVYVLKYANCQHFAHGLMGFLCKRTGRPEPRARKPALSPIFDVTPGSSPAPSSNNGSPAPLRFVPIDSASRSRAGSPSCSSPVFARPSPRSRHASPYPCPPPSPGRPLATPAPAASLCPPEVAPSCGLSFSGEAALQLQLPSA